MFNLVVVGADDSATARQAVLVAAEIARLAAGTLHIVTAYDPKSVQIEHLPLEFRYTTTTNPADALLHDLEHLVAGYGLETVVHASAGEPAEAIVAVAEEVGADLLVVGNRGMKGVRRVLGSVPNTVAHRAHCSVLIVDTEAAS